MCKAITLTGKACKKAPQFDYCKYHDPCATFYRRLVQTNVTFAFPFSGVGQNIFQVSVSDARFSEFLPWKETKKSRGMTRYSLYLLYNRNNYRLNLDVNEGGVTGLLWLERQKIMVAGDVGILRCVSSLSDLLD